MKKILKMNIAWCKGCGICAAFCPKKVLEVKHGKVRLAGDGCVSCGRCESLCPDYAIWLEGKEAENVG